MNILKTILAVLLLAVIAITVFYPLDTFLPSTITGLIPAFLVEQPLIVIVQQYWIVLFVLVPLGAMIYVLKEIR